MNHGKMKHDEDNSLDSHSKICRQNETVEEKKIEDPAEYLLVNEQYHDCYIRVGNSDTEKVEVIGVVRSNLVAHSTVFRNLLVDSGLADPTGENTHIRDISPQVFRIMLRHVYGGKLNNLQDVSSDMLEQLAICADKYNIQPLLRRACKRMLPITESNVFPALQLMEFITCPVLEPNVTKVIQEETKYVLSNAKFLQMNQHFVEFIVKQPKLSVPEIDLWKSLVKWSQHKASDSNSTPRQYLKTLLPHVRLATLTIQEIIYGVMPKDILTAEEIVDLLRSISTKKPVQSLQLCSNRQSRQSEGVDYFEEVRFGQRRLKM